MCKLINTYLLQAGRSTVIACPGFQANV